MTKRLGTPRKFLATEPSAALEIMFQAKLGTLRSETDALERKKDELLSHLEGIALRIEDKPSSIELLSQQDNAVMKFTHMFKKARAELLVAASLDHLEKTLFDQSMGIEGNSQSKVNVRIVVEEFDGPEQARWPKPGLHLSKQVELRHVETLPFTLLIVDDKEALWGEPGSDGENALVLWTNHPKQIAVLRMAFENLWEKSGTCAYEPFWLTHC